MNVEGMREITFFFLLFFQLWKVTFFVIAGEMITGYFIKSSIWTIPMKNSSVFTFTLLKQLVGLTIFLYMPGHNLFRVIVWAINYCCGWAISKQLNNQHFKVNTSWKCKKQTNQSTSQMLLGLVEIDITNSQSQEISCIHLKYRGNNTRSSNVEVLE